MAFRTALDDLLKVRRGVYASVPTEICRSFIGVSIEHIRSNRDMILMDNDSIIIKLRLPDRNQHLSKADGYRLVYIVMKNVPVVCLLTVYPKRGSMQKPDLENGELQRLMDAFIAESNARQVVVHDIYNNLAVVPNVSQF